MLKQIKIHRSGDSTDFYGSNREVKQIANIIGKTWSAETPWLRASVTLGFYENDVEENVKKIEVENIKVFR